MLPAGCNVAGALKLYISENSSKQDRYPSTLTIDNALRYNLCCLQDLTLPDNSNYTFLRIQANKIDILPQIPMPRLSDRICVAGWIKRCPDNSNDTILRI